MCVDEVILEVQSRRDAAWRGANRWLMLSVLGCLPSDIQSAGCALGTE